MMKVPRHRFVAEDDISYAYNDEPIPIGYGQTISQPYVVGFMAEHMRLEPFHRVLEIGTGCGYNAAVLSELVADVYSMEIVGAALQRNNRASFSIGLSQHSIAPCRR